LVKNKNKKNNDCYIFENGDGQCLKKILFSEISLVSHEKFLDFILTLLINQDGILDKIILFHCSAYVKDNCGYIFLGKTGAGKSTI